MSTPAGQKSRKNREFRSLVKDACNEFSALERNFFLSLTESENSQLNGGKTGRPEWYHAAHSRHHFKIMLALKEVNPSALIVHESCASIFTRMVQQCLIPVIRDYNLEQYGFILQQITHPLPTEKNYDFQHGWIFADKRSPQWRDVCNLFLTPPPSAEKAKEKDIGTALGYPINSFGPVEHLLTMTLRN